MASSDRRRGGWFDEHLGSLAGTGLCLAAAVVSLGGGAALAARVLVVVSLVGAVVLAQRREDASYFEFVVWLWLLTPGVRRIVDLETSYTEQSSVLLAAPLASLPGIASGLVRRPRAHPLVGRVFCVAVVAATYATAAGFIRHGPTPALVGGLVWLAPIGIGLWILSAPCSAAQLRSSISRLSIAGALVVGGYGVYQFFFLPEWDVHWMSNVELVSIGRPEPLEVRVFGTLNAPVPYAMTLGALLIVASAARSRAKGLTVAAGFAGLALSLVRTAWLGFVVSVAALVSGGRARTSRALLILIVVPAVLLVGIGGPAQEVVVSRFDATVERGSEDRSFSDRVATHSRELPAAMTDVSGRGFGPVGAGAGAVDDGRVGDTNRSPDSAILEVLMSMGVLVGSAFLVSVVTGGVGMWRWLRRGTDLERAIGAALLGLVVQAPLGNPFTSAPGVVFWSLLALAGRAEVGEPAPQRLAQRWVRTAS